jgi:DNA-binding MarR family transcriptional regulator
MYVLLAVFLWGNSTAVKKHRRFGGVNGGVNPVLDFIMRNPGCRANLLAEKLNISVRSVQRNLSQLKKDGYIEFRGAPKNGGYFVK